MKPSHIAVEQYRAGRMDLLWVEQLQAEHLAFEANVIKLHLALGGGFGATAAE